MRVEHPIARQDTGVVDDYVDVNGEPVPVDDDGTFEIPDGARGWLEQWADGYGFDADDLLVLETCQVVKSDGDVCGRDLPCPYHTEED